MSGEHKDSLERESAFHDKWADSEDVYSIDVYQLFESITAMENKFIASHMGRLENRRILDIGCGLGESAVYFALKGAKVTAIDISPHMIHFAQKLAQRYNVNIEFITSSTGELHFEDKHFDFIYCANLIHHLPISERLTFIQNVHRLLRNGGWFYSWDPLKYNPAIKVYRKIAHKVRSSDETPLDFLILKDFKEVFSQAYHKEFWFTTLILFLKYFFMNRYNPNEVRYWKKIYKERSEDIGWWFYAFAKVDNICLKLPLLNRLAWNILIYAQK